MNVISGKAKGALTIEQAIISLASLLFISPLLYLLSFDIKHFTTCDVASKSSVCALISSTMGTNNFGEIRPKRRGNKIIEDETTLMGTASDLADAFSKLTTMTDEAVTIVGINATIAELNIIAAGTTGIVTATIQGTAGNDTFDFKTVTGMNVNLTILAGAGNDTITGAAGNNIITGGDGNDTITGGAGNDIISGGAGNDTITGGLGNNIITGGDGNDTITGGAGNDIIDGGTGADTMTGGAGADIFVIGNFDSGLTVATADKITDFVTTIDKISFGFDGEDGGGASDTFVASDTSVADFASALLAANAALSILAANSTATELAAYQFDATNGYLFNDIDGSGNADQVIVLYGIGLRQLVASDIIARKITVP